MLCDGEGLSREEAGNHLRRRKCDIRTTLATSALISISNCEIYTVIGRQRFYENARWVFRIRLGEIVWIFCWEVKPSIHDPTWYAVEGSFYTVRFTIRNFFCGVRHAGIFTVAGHGTAPGSNRVPRGVQDQIHVFTLPGFQSSSSFSRVNIVPLWICFFALLFLNTCPKSMLNN